MATEMIILNLSNLKKYKIKFIIKNLVVIIKIFARFIMNNMYHFVINAIKIYARNVKKSIKMKMK